MSLDLAFARSQFPALSDAPDGWVFMDNAGGSQILGSVVDRIRDYLLTSNVQIGASYAISELAADRLRNSQVQIADLLNAERPEEVVMGPSSTVLLQTLARAMAPRLQPGDEIVVSRIDHESNIGPWVALEALGVTVKFWPLSRETMTSPTCRTTSSRTTACPASCSRATLTTTCRLAPRAFPTTWPRSAFGPVLGPARRDAFRSKPPSLPSRSTRRRWPSGCSRSCAPGGASV